MKKLHRFPMLVITALMLCFRKGETIHRIRSVSADMTSSPVPVCAQVRAVERTARCP